MDSAAAQVTVSPGSIPFSVVGLIGRPVSDLARLGGWDNMPDSPELGPRASRRRYRAWGRAGAQHIDLYVLARVLDDRIWAVAIHADSFLFSVRSADAGTPHLVALPRPDDLSPDVVNWISTRDGDYFDVGLAA